MSPKQWALTLLVVMASYQSGDFIHGGDTYYAIVCSVSLITILLVCGISTSKTSISIGILEGAAFVILGFSWAYYARGIESMYWFNHHEEAMDSIAAMQLITLIIGFPHGIFSRVSEYLGLDHILHFPATRFTSNARPRDISER